jgi:EmrB/QacA subfamily drug resistance transporter
MTNTAAQPPATATMPDARFRWTRAPVIALAVLCMAQLLEAIDITVVNVALPTIKHDLSFSTASLQWVVNAYAVLFGGFLLLGGRAGDLLGRRRVLVTGITVFTAASLASGLAPSASVLVATRAVQGLAAAFASPMTLGMLASIFPEGPPRSRAIALWGATAGVSSSLGLVLGGLLVSGPGWRWIFFVNVPLGALMLAAAPRYLPADRPARHHRRFDAPGAVSVTAAMILLAYAVVQTDTHPWGSARTIALLAGAGALLAYFIVNEALIAQEPLVPFSLLRNRSVTAANIVQGVCTSGLFAMFYFTSLYQQQVLHYSALKTGIAFVPLTATLVVVAGLGPLLTRRIGVRFVLAAGAAIGAVGLALFARISPTGGVFTDIIGPSMVLSTGFALMFIPLTIAAVAGVPASQTGVASGLLNTTRQVAGALGLAILATLVAARTTHLLHAGHSATVAQSDGFHLGYTIAAVLMGLTALAALTLFRDEGRGQTIDVGELAVSSVDS